MVSFYKDVFGIDISYPGSPIGGGGMVGGAKRNKGALFFTESLKTYQVGSKSYCGDSDTRIRGEGDVFVEVTFRLFRGETSIFQERGSAVPILGGTKDRSWGQVSPPLDPSILPKIQPILWIRCIWIWLGSDLAHLQSKATLF